MNAPLHFRPVIRPCRFVGVVLTGSVAGDTDSSGHLARVRAYADAHLQHGRDTYGPRSSPLIVTCVLLPTFEHIGRENRPKDAVFRAANPQLDQNFYQILYALTAITAKDDRLDVCLDTKVFSGSYDPTAANMRVFRDYVENSGRSALLCKFGCRLALRLFRSLALTSNPGPILLCMIPATLNHPISFNPALDMFDSGRGMGRAMAELDPDMMPSRASLSTLGFNVGKNGAHTARTLMFEELTALLADGKAVREHGDYFRAVVEQNVLSKSTASSKRRTFEHLVSLYALDAMTPIFRLFVHFWRIDPAGRPQIALVAARARDPLLELGTEFLIPLAPGERYERPEFEKFIDSRHPGRFSEKMRRSLAQNIASTFTQVGFFEGRVTKVRRQPRPSVGAVALGLALSKLAGSHGLSVWQSPWTRILGMSPGVADDAAREASRRGWIDYRRVGEVVSLSFRDVARELQICELA